MVEKNEEVKSKNLSEGLNSLQLNDAGANDFSSVADKKLVVDPEDKIEAVVVKDANVQVENLFEGKEEKYCEEEEEEEEVAEEEELA